MSVDAQTPDVTETDADREDAEAGSDGNEQAFEVRANISVIRCDEMPLSEQDQSDALDRIALALGDASDDTLTFICGVAPVEPLQERTGQVIEPAVPLRERECVACHIVTTLVEANQCPSCGNPFS